MTAPIFYLSSLVFSATAIFALWQLGLKRLMLDDFRDSLFVTRDRLYVLAREGRIDCDDEAYRSVEMFINRTIQYAHRFTFLSFLFSIIHEPDAVAQPSANSPWEEMLKQIEKVKDDSVRLELTSLVREVMTLLPRYIGKSSLMFMISTIIYVVFRSFSPSIASGKQQAIKTFEVEAYRDAKFTNYSPA
jgi:hypothetical protein